ncbi:hypothetical protein [Halogeometricum borinquense]|uniref:hypothetical protein n=1 Tax=Halogeometricum borinquense TaxID=60847 RepID=UPI00343C8964
MSDESGESSATGSLVSGVSNLFYLVGLWLAFGTMFTPLSAIVNAVFVAEPFSFGQLVSQIFVLVALVVTNARYPEVSAFWIWATGLVSMLIFAASAGLAGVLEPNTSGSLAVIFRLLLFWVGSIMLAVAILNHWWPEDDSAGEMRDNGSLE